MKQKDKDKGLEAAAVSPVIHPALKQYFTYRFYKLGVRLRAQVNEALERHGVLGIHLGLLHVIILEGRVSQIALGRSLGIDKATMVKLLDDLEKLGLVQRVASAGDRRVKEIVVTPKGMRLTKTGTRLREEIEDRFFSPLSREERADLDRMLSKLIDSMGVGGVPCDIVPLRRRK